MKLLKGICSSCKKDTMYFEGRNWFGRKDILCNECVSFKHKEIARKVEKLRNERLEKISTDQS